ncbi:MAG: hypothetical protein JSS51_07635 [Planctomycetes bacterium]|nr:hypothetical protein [Planctomycetota bacterium]
MRWISVCVAAAAASGVLAQSNEPYNAPGTTRVTLANKFAGVVGGGVNDAPIHASGRTLEWVFSGSQLSMLGSGSRVRSAAFRSAVTGNGPADFADFSAWTLELARSLAAPGSLLPVIADNIDSDNTLVKSGGLTVLPGSVVGQPTAGKPAPFSLIAGFEQTYDYVGGNLHLLLRHDDSGEPGVNMDAALLGDVDTNVLFQARKAESANAATTTENVGTPVTRLGVDACAALPRIAARASNGVAGFLGALGAGEFAGQFVIAAEELRSVPRGSLLTWLAFRLAPGQSAWPSGAMTSADFEVAVASAATRPGSMETAFANNELFDSLLVRDGALTLPAQSFEEGAWGVQIHFQRGFVYVGGDLCVTVRHAGFTGGPGPVLDTGNPGTAMRTVVANSKTATGGQFLAQDASIAMEVGYTPSLCVPNSIERMSGGSGAFLFETPRVHQLIIDESQLAHLTPGSTVDGIAFRISSVSPGAYVTWPETDVSVTQFDVYLSTATRLAANMSTTFAANEGADKVRVRSGDLFVPAGAMKVLGPEAGEHSFVISFPTPFVYQGGGLCITMRIGQRFGGNSVNFDGKFNTFGVNGKRSTASSSETVGNNALALATRLIFTRPAPTCPADLNGDTLVDDLDFQIFVGAYDVLLSPLGDFNFDAVTDDADFQVFLRAYGDLVCGT